MITTLFNSHSFYGITHAFNAFVYSIIYDKLYTLLSAFPFKLVVRVKKFTLSLKCINIFMAFNVLINDINGLSQLYRQFRHRRGGLIGGGPTLPVRYRSPSLRLS